MSDFSIFESLTGSESEHKIAQQAATDKLAAAIYDVREQYGEHLFCAKSKDEFHDRVALCKDDMIRTVNAHLMPVTGVMRKVCKAMEREWKQRIAAPKGDEWDDESFYDDNEAYQTQTDEQREDDRLLKERGKKARRRTANRPLHEIAKDIKNNWPKVNYAAQPYLDALHELDSVDDMYYADPAKHIVNYFLSNANTWRGPEAKRIKDELKGMVRTADNTGPVQDIDPTFSPSDDELIPEGDFHGYLDSVAQNGYDNPGGGDPNFTSGGDSGKQARRLYAEEGYGDPSGGGGMPPPQPASGGGVPNIVGEGIGGGPIPGSDAGNLIPTSPPSPGLYPGSAMDMPLVASRRNANEMMGYPSAGAPAMPDASGMVPTDPAQPPAPGTAGSGAPGAGSGAVVAAVTKRYAQWCVANLARPSLSTMEYYAANLSDRDYMILTAALQGTRRTAAGGSKDYLQQADEAITNLLNEKAEEFQESIQPLQQALQTIQYAEQVQAAQNPMNVMPPAGTVNVLPQTQGPQGPAPQGVDPASGQIDPAMLAQLMGQGGVDPAAMQGGPPPAAAGQGALPPEIAQQMQMQARRRTARDDQDEYLEWCKFNGLDPSDTGNFDYTGGTHPGIMGIHEWRKNKKKRTSTRRRRRIASQTSDLIAEYEATDPGDVKSYELEDAIHHLAEQGDPEAIAYLEGQHGEHDEQFHGGDDDEGYQDLPGGVGVFRHVDAAVSELGYEWPPKEDEDEYKPDPRTVEDNEKAYGKSPKKAEAPQRGRTAKDSGCTCWDGYERVPGTKPCASGSCRKKTSRRLWVAADGKKDLGNCQMVCGNPAEGTLDLRILGPTPFCRNCAERYLKVKQRSMGEGQSAGTFREAGIFDQWQKWLQRRSQQGQLGTGGDKDLYDFANEVGIGQTGVQHLRKLLFGSRKQAWTGWGPSLAAKQHSAPGWEWDHRLSAFVANDVPKDFACKCGAKLSVPGYHNCKCGKIWNSYVIGTGGENRQAAVEKFLCREIPVRDNVIVANRKLAWEDDGNGGKICRECEAPEYYGHYKECPNYPSYVKELHNQGLMSPEEEGYTPAKGHGSYYREGQKGSGWDVQRPFVRRAISDQTRFQEDFGEDLKSGEEFDEQQKRFVDYFRRFHDMTDNATGKYKPRPGLVARRRTASTGARYVLLPHWDIDECHRILTQHAQEMGGKTALQVTPELMEQAHAGGFTLHDHVGDAPTDGYMVSLDKHSEESMPIADLRPEMIEAFVGKHADNLAKKGNYLGGWLDRGRFYLDVSSHIPDLNRATGAAVRNKQLGIYDLSNKRTVDTDEAGWRTGHPGVVGKRRRGTAHPAQERSARSGQHPARSSRSATAGKDNCPACGKGIRSYDLGGTEDHRGQKWCKGCVPDGIKKQMEKEARGLLDAIATRAEENEEEFASDAFPSDHLPDTGNTLKSTPDDWHRRDKNQRWTGKA